MPTFSWWVLHCKAYLMFKYTWTSALLIQGCYLNHFINNDYYNIFTNLKHSLKLPLFWRRSLNEMTGKARASPCTPWQACAWLGNFWSKAVLSASANCLNWKHFAKSTSLITLHAFHPFSYGTCSYSPLEIVVIPYQTI